MPIPTQTDYDLADIENRAGGILVQLSIMRRGDPKQAASMREQLRGRLQEYVDAVMELARILPRA